MKKIKPSDLRREAEAMIRDGSMPCLEALLEAAACAREKLCRVPEISAGVRSPILCQNLKHVCVVRLAKTTGEDCTI